MSNGSFEVTAAKTTFAQHYCIKCGVLFAVPSWVDHYWKEFGKRFHCPNGHKQSYSESRVGEVARLKGEVDGLKKDLQSTSECKEGGAS